MLQLLWEGWWAFVKEAADSLHQIRHKQRFAASSSVLLCTASCWPWITFQGISGCCVLAGLCSGTAVTCVAVLSLGTGGYSQLSSVACLLQKEQYETVALRACFRTAAQNSYSSCGFLTRFQELLGQERIWSVFLDNIVCIYIFSTSWCSKHNVSSLSGLKFPCFKFIKLAFNDFP